MQMFEKAVVILKEPKATEGSHEILRCAQDDRKKNHQSGNAVLFILIAVALFGALSYTFMRGSKSGQGNLSSNQARIAAQELVNYLGSVERATQKLRQRGCSENDISFANPFNNSSYYPQNDPATAPVDKSCHVFESNGGGLTAMDISRFQIPIDQITPLVQPQWGLINYFVDYPVLGLGTAANEKFMAINFVKPEICQAVNTILNNAVDTSILETPGGTVGDENTTLVGKTVFCNYRNTTYQNGGPHAQVAYVWAIN